MNVIRLSGQKPKEFTWILAAHILCKGQQLSLQKRFTSTILSAYVLLQENLNLWTGQNQSLY